MEFHQTIAGKRFFESQLPRLISALSEIAASLKKPTPVFKLEQEVPPDFLESIYFGKCDPSELVVTDKTRARNAAIIAQQNRMRSSFSSEEWEEVEQYKTLLDTRGEAEREEAFASGFRYAAKLFAAGLSVPQGTVQEN